MKQVLFCQDGSSFNFHYQIVEADHRAYYGKPYYSKNGSLSPEIHAPASVVRDIRTTDELLTAVEYCRQNPEIYLDCGVEYLKDRHGLSNPIWE